MIVFAKDSAYENGVCCFDIRLSRDSVNQVLISTKSDHENCEYVRNSTDSQYLVDSSGMVYTMEVQYGKVFYNPTLTTNEILLELRNSFEGTDYSWAVWSLVNPILATEGTVKLSKNFKFHPLFENETFSKNAMENNFPFTQDYEGISIGYFPRVIFNENEKEFRKEFIKSSLMLWQNEQTNLMKTINRQQRVIVPEKTFDNEEFSRMCPRNTGNFVHTITRSTVDFINLFVAQMVTFKHLGIIFADDQLNILQNAICFSSNFYQKSSRPSRPYPIMTMTELNGNGEYESAWRTYSMSLIYESQHFVKISAQLKIDYTKLGSYDDDGNIQMNADSVNEYFLELVGKTSMKRSKNSIISNELRVFSMQNNKADPATNAKTDSPLLWGFCPHDPTNIIHRIVKELTRQYVKDNVNQTFEWSADSDATGAVAILSSDKDQDLKNWDSVVRDDEKFNYRMNMGKLAAASRLQLSDFLAAQTTEIAKALEQLHGGMTEASFKKAIGELFVAYVAARQIIGRMKTNSASKFEGMYQATCDAKKEVAAGRMVLSLNSYVALGLNIRSTISNRADYTVETAIEKASGKEKEEVKESEEKEDLNRSYIPIEKSELNRTFGFIDRDKNTFFSIKRAIEGGKSEDIEFSDIKVLLDKFRVDPQPETILHLLRTYLDDYKTKAVAKNKETDEILQKLNMMIYEVFKGQFHAEQASGFKNLNVTLKSLPELETKVNVPLNFLRAWAIPLPKGLNDGQEGEQLTSLHPYNQEAKPTRLIQLKPPPITLAMLPKGKHKRPQIPSRWRYKDISMHKYLTNVLEQFFEEEGIESPQVMARFIYRMWSYRSDDQKLFMRLFPESSIQSIDSTEAYDKWIEQIVNKYDGQPKDKTYTMGKMVRKSRQKHGERIETYCERMMEYLMAWKGVKSIEEGSDNSIILTNAIVQKLSNPIIKQKLETDHVGLLQKGKLEDVKRFINDYHQGRRYMKTQSALYNPDRESFDTKNSHRRRHGNFNVNELDGHPPPFETQEESGGSSTDMSEVENGEEVRENGIHQIFKKKNFGRKHGDRPNKFGEHGKSRNFGDRPNKFGEHGKSRNFGDKDKFKDNHNREGYNRDRNDFRNSDHQHKKFSHSIKRIHPKEFTRKKAHAKRILGFRRVLENKNVNRKDGSYRNKVPDWYKGPQRNYIPKEEYLAIRSKHLTSKPLRVAKREKNMHKVDVANHIENLNSTQHDELPAWAIEMNNVQKIDCNAETESFFENYEIFEITPHDYLTELSEYDHNATGYCTPDNSDSDGSQEDLYNVNVQQAPPANRRDYDYLDINSIEINEVDEADHKKGEAMKTYYCDIFIDSDRTKERTTTVTKAIQEDCMRRNRGNGEKTKYCSIAVLFDSGASVSLIPKSILDKINQEQSPRIETIPTGQTNITSANRSEIEVIGKTKIDFSMLAAPLLNPLAQPTEIRFKDVLFYVVNGVDKTIIGENVINELNDKQGIMFSTKLGKTKVPPNHMVVGLKDTVNAAKLKIIKFYKERPKTRYTGYVNTLDIPVNYLSPSRNNLATIFNVDGLERSKNQIKPEKTNNNAFHLYSWEPILISPGAEEEINIGHDNERRIEDSYQLTAYEEGMDIHVISLDRAVIKNNRSTPMVIGLKDRLAVVFNPEHSQVFKEIHNISCLRTNSTVGKDTNNPQGCLHNTCVNEDCNPDINTIEIDCGGRYSNSGNFEVNHLDIDSFSDCQRREPVQAEHCNTAHSKIVNEINQKTIPRVQGEKVSKPNKKSKEPCAQDLTKKYENTMEDPCKKYTGIDKYGQWVQKWKDPMFVYDSKKKQMKWSDRGMPLNQRKEFDSQRETNEHPLKTLDNQIKEQPDTKYQNLYFPEGALQKN